MDYINSSFLIDGVLLTKLVLAMVLGMILGIERLYAHKTASMRTYALVSMGSALFVILSVSVLAMQGNTTADPLRVAAQIIAAAGFFGAGIVFFKDDNKITGMTTAAGLWVSAGIGMACGFGMFGIAIASTVLTLFIFTVLWFIENRLKKTKFISESNPEDYGK
jgi:putative Mg2+ transporter-C (MgtC) family protein